MITSLRLQNFRSYEDASFEFGSGVNIIVGPNGSGKTNLLEAVQVVASGGSYRVHDGDLVRFGAPWLRLDATTEDGQDRTVKITNAPRLVKTYEINEKPYKRLIHQHTVPVVLFEPNHLQLLHGAPELRRNYLDDILEQTGVGFAVYRRNYRRVLAQRNALLKRGRPATAELFPWDLRLSELGAVIARSRATLCDALAKQLPGLYHQLARTETTVRLTYQPLLPIDAYETNLLHKLEHSRAADIDRGFTAYGPHREDFMVEFDGHQASLSASRGETRTLVLALKIIELELIEQANVKRPLLLLDDVFSELDGARRRALTTYIQTHQSFLTTTDADVVIKHFTDSAIIPLGEA